MQREIRTMETSKENVDCRNSRRRRKGPGHGEALSSFSKLTDNDNYYDDSDEDKDKMYSAACSIGQFFLNPCLCLYASLRNLKRRWYLRRSGNLPMLGGEMKPQNTHDSSFLEVLACIAFMFCCMSFLSTGPGQRGPRPASDYEVNQIPIRIPKLDTGASAMDVGGWLLFHDFAVPTDPIDLGQPNRATLQFRGLFGEPREISPFDKEEAELNWNQLKRSRPKFSPYYEIEENLEDVEQICRRANWKHLYSPTCNNLHEVDLMNDYPSGHVRLKDTQELDAFYISHGYYRDVWVLDNKDEAQKAVLKVTRWKHDYGMSLLHEILRDALIMERLTASPRIVDIYDHCGTAVRVEAIPFEVEDVIVPDGFIKQKELHDESDVQPQNDYTATEKLEIALDMAESLADLHGFEGGIIVHDDVQLCQWLRKKDGTLKLGDFNRAEIMDYNTNKGEYCKYINGESFGNYRAPEEFAEQPLDEKIDVWSFGNNIYALLTGLWVFYENEDDEIVHSKLIDGKTAYIDPRYKKRSYAEQQLVKLLEQCWHYKPEDRPSMFELVDRLRQAVTENTRLKGPGEEEALPVEDGSDGDAGDSHNTEAEHN